MATWLALGNFYRIPSSDTLRKMIENTCIEKIYISSKFSSVRELGITIKKTEVNIFPDAEPLPFNANIGNRFNIIQSPMVGTFYINDDKTGKPYVEIGQVIMPGVSIAHIIAMNLKTEIVSGTSGVVIKIIPKNDCPVEFGQVIIHIRQT